MHKVSDLTHMFSGLEPPKIINQPKATERRFTEHKRRRWHNLKQIQRYGCRRLSDYQRYQHFYYKVLGLGVRHEMTNISLGFTDLMQSDHTVIHP